MTLEENIEYLYNCNLTRSLNDKYNSTFAPNFTSKYEIVSTTIIISKQITTQPKFMHYYKMANAYGEFDSLPHHKNNELRKAYALILYHFINNIDDLYELYKVMRKKIIATMTKKINKLIQHCYDYFSKFTNENFIPTLGNMTHNIISLYIKNEIHKAICCETFLNFDAESFNQQYNFKSKIYHNHKLTNIVIRTILKHENTTFMKKLYSEHYITNDVIGRLCVIEYFISHPHKIIGKIIIGRMRNIETYNQIEDEITNISSPPKTELLNTYIKIHNLITNEIEKMEEIENLERK